MPEQPTVSVGVGLTVSPKPYESIRVDLEIQNVSADNIDHALDETRPVIERAFANLLQRAMAEVEVARAEMLGKSNPQAQPRQRRVTNSAGVAESSIMPPQPRDEADRPPPLGEPFGA